MKKILFFLTIIVLTFVFTTSISSCSKEKASASPIDQLCSKREWKADIYINSVKTTDIIMSNLEITPTDRMPMKMQLLINGGAETTPAGSMFYLNLSNTDRYRTFSATKTASSDHIILVFDDLIVTAGSNDAVSQVPQELFDKGIAYVDDKGVEFKTKILSGNYAISMSGQQFNLEALTDAGNVKIILSN